MSKKKSLVRTFGVKVHACLLVMTNATLIGVLATGSSEDADIGAGLLFMVLLILGAPWSFGFFVIPSLRDMDVVSMGIWLMLLSTFNLAVHVLFRSSCHRHPGRG